MGESYVLPGAVDAHVHSLSHRNEGIAASTSAAAAGGVTTVIEMPFDHSGPINSLDRLRAKQDLADAEAVVDIALLGTLDPAGGWTRAEELAEGGVVGFKASLFDTDAFRFPRTSDRQLLDVMAATRDVGRTLCVHVENNEIIKALLDEERSADAADPQSHSRSRPPVSETLGVLTAMEVAANTGSRLHLCHLSLPRSVELASWYRGQGADITLETCPHYLTFVQDDLDRLRGHLKINPPLRTAGDREGLWARLGGGEIPVITSDHAPWPRELKEREMMLDNSSGAPGVQNIVPVILGGALRRDPSMGLFERALDALTRGPAARYGIDHRKGSLEPGKDADIMVFSPDEGAEIELGAQLSNAGWTPYAGYRPGGRITHTISRGELVFDEALGLSGRPGRGELLEHSDR
ncbi:amidohydrolase family protein [Leucobacter ruminantium]|uniref:Dihydroorotase family protein n=1 Tax=Leucobacter ruminantium TaxID=1289170 RepID=A0A939RYL2_9MICO|nr:dihydroorotase family protein [Leucobacter ruminantium]